MGVRREYSGDHARLYGCIAIEMINRNHEQWAKWVSQTQQLEFIAFYAQLAAHAAFHACPELKYLELSGQENRGDFFDRKLEQRALPNGKALPE